MSKFSLIARLQHWMDSVPGQTFMNYAYSWGAAVVILGTLFKLTHIPGANAMLFIGMGTEVFVFFIAGFDRPFDAKKDTELADEFIDLEEMEALKAAAERAAAAGEAAPVVVGGGVIAGGGAIASPANLSGETAEQTDGGGAVIAGGGGGTVIIGGGAPAGGTVVIGGGVPAAGLSPAAGTTPAAGLSPAAATTPAVGLAPAAGTTPAVSVDGGFPAVEGLPAGSGPALSATDAANLAMAAQAAAGAQAALAAAGTAEGILESAKAADAPEVEEAIESYVEQLRELTDTLSRVREQAKRMTTDSEEMENLNRTLTGINTIYEMQLKSVSQQVGTIDEITDQTRRLAKQIEELNAVYARMIEALTVNMPSTRAVREG